MLLKDQSVEKYNQQCKEIPVEVVLAWLDFVRVEDYSRLVRQFTHITVWLNFVHVARL